MAALAAHRAFLGDVLARQAERRKLVDKAHVFPVAPRISEAGPSRPRAPVASNSKLNVANYVVAEETVRNDYCEWYGVSGEWGSNYVLGVGREEICEEYPALKRLMDLKADLMNNASHPPLYLPLLDPDPGPPRPTPTSIQAAVSTNRFDAILITPPQPLDWSYIASLPLRNISADPGFVFLWVGHASGDGLERGRECFAKWGFRRAEDIVWVKTNKNGAKREEGRDEGGLFAGQKEHCLMGIRGTVRRSTDSRFVHCNVDTDVMVWEDEEDGIETRYPPYLQTLIENFCLGTRRLHLFGSPSTVRRGWVTAGCENLEPDADESAPSLFDPDLYPSQVFQCDDGRYTLPFHPDIDNLRPKSPVRKSRQLPPNSASPALGHMASQQIGYRGNGQSPIPYGMSPGISPALGMNMGNAGMGWGMGNGMMDGNYGMMGMDGGMGMGMDMSNQYSFGQQPGQQAQFDPMVLAQAQAQAQAMIQAQMQMAMMQQMQAQMGMGQGQEMYGQMQQGQYGQYGHIGGSDGMGQQGGYMSGYAAGGEQYQNQGGMDWQGQGGSQGYNTGGQR